MPLLAFFALTQYHPLQVTSPGLAENLHHRSWYFTAGCFFLNEVGGRLACTFLASPTFLSVPKTLLNQLTTAPVQIHKVAEILEQLLEQLDIVGEFIQNTINHFFNFFPERVPHALALFGPANGRQCEFIQQLANRMTATIEEITIAQGNLQDRNLQAPDQRLHHRM